MLLESLSWREPLQLARLAAAHASQWCLLYSGIPGDNGSRSFLCLHPQETISGASFSLLAEKLSHNHSPLEHAWFGYLSYELLHEIEKLPQERTHALSLPLLHFTRYGLILVFDHAAQSLTAHRLPECALPEWLENTLPTPAPTLPPVIALRSNMTREYYLQVVCATREAIAQGSFYQSNITRKFMGEWDTTPDAFALFEKLCAYSPASYSAFIRMGETAILSSSPECFLTITAAGEMETRPIKGTARRSPAAEQDASLRDALRHSEKDRAENMMIVDLMRNDLARSCETGSVRVEKLFDVTTYATLHHMVSTVTGRKRSNVSTLEAVRQCFPPGSMTGAPKIRAMEWCLQQEGIQRGVYSGALGWFGGDGSCDLSVVIRTLVTEGRHFEFQVGGGIVADSNPEKEWQETMTKARGIASALGLSITQLEAL